MQGHSHRRQVCESYLVKYTTLQSREILQTLICGTWGMNLPPPCDNQHTNMCKIKDFATLQSYNLKIFEDTIHKPGYSTKYEELLSVVLSEFH